MRIPLLILVLCIHLQNGFAQAQKSVASDNPMKSKLDTVTDKAVRAYFAMPSKVGLSLAVYADGKEYFYNYGTAKSGKQVLPSKNTMYEIGSITKTMTGVLLAKAVAENKLKLDDDVRIHLNGDYPNLQYQGSPVRLFHLLNHSSGLPFDFIDRTSLKNIPEDSIPFATAPLEKAYTKEQLLRDLHLVRLDTVPGIKLSYSNMAAQLLGLILEKVYQKTYSQLLKEYILGPLKMKNTGFYPTARQEKSAAYGYNEKGVRMPRNQSGPAGGLLSSTQDLLQYGKWQLQEKDPAIALSHQPTWGQIQYYAMGLNWQMQLKEENYRRIWQSGGVAGFSSMLVCYPEKNITIVVLVNEAGRDSQDGLGKIGNSIFENLK